MIVNVRLNVHFELIFYGAAAIPTMRRADSCGGRQDLGPVDQLHAASEAIGLTRERVRQIENHALHKLQVFIQKKRAQDEKDRIEREKIQARAKSLGALLRAGLLDLQQKHPAMGDVRGLGLLQGVELVKDRVSKSPDKDAALRVLERARDMGLLLGRGGLYGNVLRIAPPICLGEEDVTFILAVLDQALTT